MFLNQWLAMESVSVSEGGLPSKTASSGGFCCDGVATAGRLGKDRVATPIGIQTIMPKNVATDRATRREVTKFSLTHHQVMELSVRGIPVAGAAGKRAKLVDRPAEQGDKAYRVLDGNQGAPVGFGFYVGKTRTTYEVVRRGS